MRARTTTFAVCCLTVFLAAGGASARAVQPHSDLTLEQLSVTPGQMCGALQSGLMATVVRNIISLLPRRMHPGNAVRAVVGTAVKHCKKWMPIASKAGQKLYAHYLDVRTPPQSGVDRAAPAVTIPWLTIRNGAVESTGLVPVAAFWGAADLHSGLAKMVSAESILSSWFQRDHNVNVPRLETTFVNGTENQVRVAAQDRAGNWSNWSYSPRFRTVVIDQTATSALYGPGWSTAAISGAWGNTVTWTRSPGATTTFRFRAWSFGILASVLPGGSIADVYIDNAPVGQLDLRGNGSTRAIRFSWYFPDAGTRTLKIVNRGGELQIDGYALLGPP